jgi:hypothetical protein
MRALLAVAILVAALLPGLAIGQTRPVSMPVGGVVIVPDEAPLRLAGCSIRPQPPDERDGLVRAMARFQCEAGSGRRDVTIELWQLDDSGFWQPVYATAETFATTPGMGGTGKGLPLGPDEISCRATPLGVMHRYRTYAAAFGPAGEPLLHAGQIVTLPRNCLAGMAAEHLALLGLPPDSTLREVLPPMEQLSREAWFTSCPALMLSVRPWKPEDCPD